MSLVKSDESHARRLANCRGSFSPEALSDAVFIAIALRRRAGPDAPILSSCAEHFPTSTAKPHSKHGAKGTRLLESLRFPAFAAGRWPGEPRNCCARFFRQSRQNSATPALGSRAYVE